MAVGVGPRTVDDTGLIRMVLCSRCRLTHAGWSLKPSKPSSRSDTVPSSLGVTWRLWCDAWDAKDTCDSWGFRVFGFFFGGCTWEWEPKTSIGGRLGLGQAASSGTEPGVIGGPSGGAGGVWVMEGLRGEFGKLSCTECTEPRRPSSSVWIPEPCGPGPLCSRSRSPKRLWISCSICCITALRLAGLAGLAVPAGPVPISSMASPGPPLGLLGLREKARA